MDYRNSTSTLDASDCGQAPLGSPESEAVWKCASGAFSAGIPFKAVFEHAAPRPTFSGLGGDAEGRVFVFGGYSYPCFGLKCGRYSSEECIQPSFASDAGSIRLACADYVEVESCSVPLDAP